MRALEHAGVFVDDSQIDDLRIKRGPVVPGGKVLVFITEEPCTDGPTTERSKRS